MLHLIVERVKHIVRFESVGDVLILALAEVLILFLTCHNLAEVASPVAGGRGVEAGAVDEAVTVVGGAGLWLVKYSESKVKEVLWSQIWHLVVLPVIKILKPSDLILLIRKIEVKGIYLVVNWAHRVGVQVENIDAGFLVLVGGG